MLQFTPLTWEISSAQRIESWYSFHIFLFFHYKQTMIQYERPNCMGFPRRTVQNLTKFGRNIVSYLIMFNEYFENQLYFLDSEKNKVTSLKSFWVFLTKACVTLKVGCLCDMIWYSVIWIDIDIDIDIDSYTVSHPVVSCLHPFSSLCLFSFFTSLFIGHSFLSLQDGRQLALRPAHQRQ